MAVLEASLKLNKSAADIFAYITNLENQKKMSQYITGIEVDGPLKVGSRYKIITTANGHKIVFTSYATNLVPGDTNGAPDIFLVTLP